jgi:hypothetical protein
MKLIFLCLRELRKKYFFDVRRFNGWVADKINEHDIPECQAITDFMILKIVLPENLAFFTQNKAKSCKNYIVTLVLKKNANFSPKIGKKSQKIVIIHNIDLRSTLNIFKGKYVCNLKK